MKTLLVAAGILLLQACSPLDVLKILNPTPGIEASAQIGDNDAKVGNGVGTVGDKSELIIEDSKNTSVQTTNGRYHLEAKDNLTVNIHETNRWILPMVAGYIFGRPILLWCVNYVIARVKRKPK